MKRKRRAYKKNVRYKTMARYRRRRSFGRYYGRARKYYRRASKSSNIKNILDGAIVGVATTMLPDYLPMQDALITTGVGWFRKNPTLTVLGGIQLGSQLSGMLTGGSNNVGKVSQV
jgi:uncharacterized membrane protein (UPF0136 family)